MSKTSYDAIVIGAGVLGASVAAHLAGGGYSVLILEQGEPACGASGGNLGQISVSDRWEPWHLKLTLQSLAYYEKDLGSQFDIGYERSGGSVVLSTPEQVEAARAIAQKLHAQDVPCTLYTGGDMALAEPNLALSSVQAVLHCPLEGKLNPMATTLALLSRAQGAGAVLLRGAPVTGFTLEGGHIARVHTPGGDYEARWVINCAGPRAAQVGALAGVDVPVCWHKGTAFVSQPVQRVIRGPICGGGFLLGGEGGEQPRRQIGFATVQTLDGTILIAQSTETCAVGDRSVNMPSLALVAQRFLSYFPQLEDLQIVRAWAAATTYTPDGYPVFGLSSRVDNLFTAAGFKGAFTVAPAVGERVHRALEGDMDPGLAGFGPDRCAAGEEKGLIS